VLDFKTITKLWPAIDWTHANCSVG